MAEITLEHTFKLNDDKALWRTEWSEKYYRYKHKFDNGYIINVDAKYSIATYGESSRFKYVITNINISEPGELVTARDEIISGPKFINIKIYDKDRRLSIDNYEIMRISIIGIKPHETDSQCLSFNQININNFKITQDGLKKEPYRCDVIAKFKNNTRALARGVANRSMNTGVPRETFIPNYHEDYTISCPLCGNRIQSYKYKEFYHQPTCDFYRHLPVVDMSKFPKKNQGGSRTKRSHTKRSHTKRSHTKRSHTKRSHKK